MQTANRNHANRPTPMSPSDKAKMNYRFPSKGSSTGLLHYAPALLAVITILVIL